MERSTLQFINFSVYFSLVLAIGQLFINRSFSEKLIRSTLFLIISYLLYQSIHYNICNTTINNRVFYPQITIFFLLGPIVFKTYTLILSPTANFRLIKIPPKFVTIILLITFISIDTWINIKDIGIKHSIFTRITNNTSSTYYLYKGAILFSGVVATYLLASLLLGIFKYWKISELKKTTLVTTIYTALSLIAFWAIISSILLNYRPLMVISIFTTALLLIISYLIAQKYPQFMRLLQDEVEKKRYENSHLASLNITETISLLK